MQSNGLRNDLFQIFEGALPFSTSTNNASRTFMSRPRPTSLEPSVDEQLKLGIFEVLDIPFITHRDLKCYRRENSMSPTLLEQFPRG
jgi:hypothetical protein